MNHVDNRAVLVECGFLSNPEEERALRDPEYQTRMGGGAGVGVLDGHRCGSFLTSPLGADSIKE